MQVCVLTHYISSRLSAFLSGNTLILIAKYIFRAENTDFHVTLYRRVRANFCRFESNIQYKI